MAFLEERFKLMEQLQRKSLFTKFMGVLEPAASPPAARISELPRMKPKLLHSPAKRTQGLKRTTAKKPTNPAMILLYTAASVALEISSAPSSSKISLARSRCREFSECTDIKILP
jgi:hypothetical protein